MAKQEDEKNPKESQETPEQAEVSKQLKEMAEKSEPTGVFFDPEKEITKEDWQGMKDKLERFRKDALIPESYHGTWNNSWSEFSRQAMGMKILDPGADSNIDKRAWDGMKEGRDNDSGEVITVVFAFG